MSIRIREALPADAASVFEVAVAVRMPPSMDSGRAGRGFLVDVSLEHYRHFIDNDHVLLLEEGNAGRTLGFSVILGPETMAETGIRRQAERIVRSDAPKGDTAPAGSAIPVSAESLDGLDPRACAYWEQLAVLPDCAGGPYPVYLAFASLERAFCRYEHLFGAVASYPVGNLAPLRLLECAGWRKVGSIETDYPAHGSIRYDVYHLSRSQFEGRLQEPLLAGLRKRLRARGLLP